jgi:hypothetical protein
MEQIKTTPNFLPLEKFDFTDEQLVEMYNIVFFSVHTKSFKISEMKDLLFDKNYYFVQSRKENWKEKLKIKLIEFGYNNF